jgi:peptidoglycan/LPS O-acetylase OafA/YrhL
VDNLTEPTGDGPVIASGHDLPSEASRFGGGTQLPYMPALDGLRAVAILAVLCNHGGFGWAAGGILGVNTFFVLSGFLITMLLLKEWAGSATIRLLAFWGRRARRLLPALFFLLAGVAVYAWLFAPAGTQPTIRSDGLASFFYVGNWHQILTGQRYFAEVSAPSPLLHTWSLAIEEQFYLVWPLVVLGVLQWWRSTRLLLAVAVVGVLASALEMAFLFHPGGDPSRAYYGTDTRAQDILLGAVVAIVLSGRLPALGHRARMGLSWGGGAARVGFAVVWAHLSGTGAFTYRGGFLSADVMVAVVIVGVTQVPDGLPARLLSLAPLRYLGMISYGLYLWHWPVFLVLTHARTGLDGWALFVVRCAASLGMALVSWYLVETPVRRMSLAGWRSWTWVPVAAVATVAVLLVATSVDTAAASDNQLLGPANPKASPPAVYVYAFPKSPHLAPVLFVGDSLSLYLAYGLAPYAAHFGLSIGGRTLSGCALSTAEPFILHGVITYSQPPGRCQTWAAQYQADVDQLHPRVAVLVTGWWEAMDRMYQGRWQHLGDPAYDAYERGQFEQAVSVLSSQGAQVVLMTAPYFDTGEQPDGQPWDEDSPARVDELNAIINSVAAEHPDTVRVVPLNRQLDPDGHFTWTIDGKTMRLSDGVHTTPAAGTYLAPKVLPVLAAASRKG